MGFLFVGWWLDLNMELLITFIVTRNLAVSEQSDERYK